MTNHSNDRTRCQESIITNSFTHAVAKNYFDGGREYYYCITSDGVLEYKIGSGNWNSLPKPNGERVKNVAADNNRVFILTDKNRLYWRCLLEDSASWVLFIFKVAECIGSTVANELIWPHLEDSKVIEGQEYDNLEDWAAIYYNWVIETHKPGDGPPRLELPPNFHRAEGWNPLENRGGINSDHVVDIAVGNWNNTVVTYYVLVAEPNKSGKSHKIMFLDEEPLMQKWEDVPRQEMISLDSKSLICASHSVIAATCGNRIYWIRFDAHTNDHIPFWPLNWNEAWTGIPKELEDLLTNIPSPPEPPVDRIPLDTGPPYDIPFGEYLPPPVDFFDRDNYPGWHSVEAPAESICEFLIDVAYGGANPWPVPKPYIGRISGVFSFLSPAWSLYFRIAAISAVIDIARSSHTEVGFIGENSIKPNWNYPVCCIIKSGQDYQGFMIHRSRDAPLAQWQVIENGGSSANEVNGFVGWVIGRVTDGLSEVCDWADRLEQRCSVRRFRRCAEEEDRGYEECTRREEQGYKRCREWRFQCPDWVPDWACNAANDVARLVCVAWTWLSNWVCVAWTWISNIVCILWAWIVITVCKFVTRSIKGISCWARPCWKKIPPG